MAAQDANDTPRKGQYLSASVLVDFEGGGNLVYAVEPCAECGSLVDTERINEHMGKMHETAPPPESGPK